MEVIIKFIDLFFGLPAAEGAGGEFFILNLEDVFGAGFPAAVFADDFITDFAGLLSIGHGFILTRDFIAIAFWTFFVEFVYFADVNLSAGGTGV